MGLHDRIKGPANGTAQLQPDGGASRSSRRPSSS